MTLSGLELRRNSEIANCVFTVIRPVYIPLCCEDDTTTTRALLQALEKSK